MSFCVFLCLFFLRSFVSLLDHFCSNLKNARKKRERECENRNNFIFVMPMIRLIKPPAKQTFFSMSVCTCVCVARSLRNLCPKLISRVMHGLLWFFCVLKSFVCIMNVTENSNGRNTLNDKEAGHLKPITFKTISMDSVPSHAQIDVPCVSPLNPVCACVVVCDSDNRLQKFRIRCHFLRPL